jgi:FAD/FMN-containing dehydrogenase
MTDFMVNRGDERYEAVRASMVWNARKPPRRPEAIAQAASVADVQGAVRTARTRGLRVSARSSGHHFSAPALRDNGLLIDVSSLRSARVDVETKTAIVQPGFANGDLARRLTAEGLAFPYGHCSGVALGGYLLGGGFGWNSRAWGVACWNVTGIDVVTADGDEVHASAENHPDLFWAARGAGTLFPGIVVGYHLRLFDLPRAIHATTLVYPLECAAELTRWAAETSAALPRTVEMVLSFAAAPPGREASHVSVLLATAFEDSIEAALAALRPITSCPIGSGVMLDPPAPRTFDDLFAGMDGAFPTGKRYGVDMMWLGGDPVASVGTLAARLSDAPSKQSHLLVIPLPPPTEPLPDAAFSMAGALYFGCYGIWDAEFDDAKNLAWVTSTAAAVAGAAVGYYIGETDLTVEASRTRRCFSDASWERLEIVRKRYDPSGLFSDAPSVGRARGAGRGGE